MKYNKLVRDKIPEYIVGKGGKPVFHIAGEKEYWEKLKEKLGEEVAEFVRAESMEEVADILEVLEAICTYRRFEKTELEVIQAKKAAERGKFIKRVILDES